MTVGTTLIKTFYKTLLVGSGRANSLMWKLDFNLCHDTFAILVENPDDTAEVLFTSNDVSACEEFLSRSQGISRVRTCTLVTSGNNLKGYKEMIW